MRAGNASREIMIQSDDIRNLMDKGIKTSVDLYIGYHKVANNIATDGPQEGSEHCF